jgi:hypothetical protein
MTMNGFFASLFAEMGARRRRMRAVFGDRGQALMEFLVLGGLLLGSLGLFVRDGMIDKAPWGFAVPLVFLIGFLVIDARRQARQAQQTEQTEQTEQTQQAQQTQETPNSAETEQAKTSGRHDWIVVLWSFGCALLGVGAFMLAWTSQTRAPAQQEWQPPREAVDVDISP